MSKQKHCHFDCASGVAGDMLLAAFIHAGADFDEIHRAVAGLFKNGDVSVRVKEVVRSGISGYSLKIEDSGVQSLRHWSTIKELIENAVLSEAVKARALAILGSIAAAEAKIHAIDIEKVHFHEIGAVDTLVDVVGSCVAIEQLGLSTFSTSPVNVGGGTIKIDHGIVPVPAPATLALARAVSIYGEPDAGELATPTGMAILANLCGSSAAIPSMRPEQIGYGAGSKNPKGRPNVIRACIGRLSDEEGESIAYTNSFNKVYEISANIDDQSPEEVAFAAEKLFEAGALDVWQASVFMKKGRSAIILSCLCSIADKVRITSTFFKHTTSIGLRFQIKEREVLERELITVVTKYGGVSVKLAKIRGQIVNIAPEFEDCRKAAERFEVSLADVMLEARMAIGSSEN